MSKDKVKKTKVKEVVSTDTETNEAVVFGQEETNVSDSVESTSETKNRVVRLSKAEKRKLEKYEVEIKALQKILEWIDSEYERINVLEDKKLDKHEKAMEAAKDDDRREELLDKRCEYLSKTVGAVSELERLRKKINNRLFKLAVMIEKIITN